MLSFKELVDRFAVDQSDLELNKALFRELILRNLLPYYPIELQQELKELKEKYNALNIWSESLKEQIFTRMHEDSEFFEFLAVQKRKGGEHLKNTLKSEMENYFDSEDNVTEINRQNYELLVLNYIDWKAFTKEILYEIDILENSSEAQDEKDEKRVSNGI